MLLFPLRHLFAAALTLTPLLAMAQVSPAICGSLDNGGNGPFDYRVVRGRELKVVEDFHFNAKVEALVAGQSGTIGDDLSYVLRVFPNHHRALVAATRLAKRSKSPTAAHMPLPMECYYERAVRFRPDDTVARLLFAGYLNDLKRPDEAVQQLDRAIELASDNPFTQYNAGLVFAEMNLFDRALQQAHKAQRLGFMRPELKQKLQAAGKWVDPPDEAAAAAAATDAASAAAATASAPGS